MDRYSLTDHEFTTIEALITYSPDRGMKPTKIREIFDGILWILCSGAPWRDFQSITLPIKASTIASGVTRSTAFWSR